MSRSTEFYGDLILRIVFALLCWATALAFAYAGRGFETGMGFVAGVVHLFLAWGNWISRRPVVIPKLRHHG